MKTFRPKKKMLSLGWTIIVVSLVILCGNLYNLPMYLDLRGGSGTVPKMVVASIMFWFLASSSTLAVFLLILARSIFRIRKALKDDEDAA